MLSFAHFATAVDIFFARFRQKMQDLSPSQTHVLQQLLSDRANAVVMARAGAGKTTVLLRTLCELVDRGARCLVLAYSRATVDTVRQRCPSIEVRTMHSQGFELCRIASPELDIKVSETKIRELIKTLVDDVSIHIQVQSLVDRMHSELLVPTDLPHHRASYGYGISEADAVQASSDPRTREIYRRACEVLMNDLDTPEIMDLSACVYRATIQRCAGKWDRTFTHILIDEGQDMSLADRELVHQIALRDASAPARVIAFGDDMQGIYGFRGASVRSLHDFACQFDACLLRLSLSFRSPKVVVNMLRALCPDFGTCSRVEGSVTVLRVPSVLSLLPLLKPGDRVLGRKNGQIESLREHGVDAEWSVSTIHGAKGLECRRVFLIDPHGMHCRDSQETNLLYVAMTRATVDVIFVCTPQSNGKTLPFGL